MVSYKSRCTARTYLLAYKTMITKAGFNQPVAQKTVNVQFVMSYKINYLTVPLKSEIQNVLIRIKGSWPANLPVRTSTGVINFFL